MKPRATLRSNATGSTAKAEQARKPRILRTAVLLCILLVAAQSWGQRVFRITELTDEDVDRVDIHDGSVEDWLDVIPVHIYPQQVEPGIDQLSLVVPATPMLNVGPGTLI